MPIHQNSDSVNVEPRPTRAVPVSASTNAASMPTQRAWLSVSRRKYLIARPGPPQQGAEVGLVGDLDHDEATGLGDPAGRGGSTIRA